MRPKPLPPAMLFCTLRALCRAESIIPKLAVFAAAKGGLLKRGFVAKEHQFKATYDVGLLLLTEIGVEALASKSW